MRKISIFLCFILFVNLFWYVPSVKAASFGQTTVEDKKIKDFDQQTIDELDKYILLDGIKTEFVITNNAKDELSNIQLIELDCYVKCANKMILQAINNKKASVNFDIMGKMVTVKKLALDFKKKTEIQPQSIDYSSYCDYELHWWGASLFISHDAVEYLRDTKTYDGTTGMMALISGMLLGPFAAPLVGGLIIIYGVYIYNMIVANDIGNGVLIESTWYGLSAGIGPYTWKFYKVR